MNVWLPSQASVFRNESSLLFTRWQVSNLFYIQDSQGYINTRLTTETLYVVDSSPIAHTVFVQDSKWYLCPVIAYCLVKAMNPMNTDMRLDQTLPVSNSSKVYDILKDFENVTCD